MNQGDNHLPPPPLDWDFNIDWDLPLEGDVWGDSSLLHRAQSANVDAGTNTNCGLDSYGLPNSNAPSQRSCHNNDPLMGTPYYGSSDQSFPPIIGDVVFGPETFPYWTPESPDGDLMRPQDCNLPQNSDTYLDASNLYPLRANENTFTNLQDNNVPGEPAAASYTSMSAPPIKRSRSAKQPKGAKPRLKCTFSNCWKTFPRPYELERHTKNVHNRTFSLLCPVYGCPRSEKAVPREDKFLEHFRKHKNDLRFLCPLPDCGAGPLSRTELKSHLSTHQMTQFEGVKFAIAKSLNLIPAAQHNGMVLLMERDECPLRFMGCTFQAPEEFSADLRPTLRDHLKEHDLRERSIGYDAIIMSTIYWSRSGLASCLMCDETFSNTLWLMDHVVTHPQVEWTKHDEKLYEQLSPWVEGKAKMYFTILEEEVWQNRSNILRNWKTRQNSTHLANPSGHPEPTMLGSST